MSPANGNNEDLGAGTQRNEDYDEAMTNHLLMQINYYSLQRYKIKNSKNKAPNAPQICINKLACSEYQVGF